MKKILLISMRISGSAVAKKIAEDNPEIEVHLIGSKIEGKLPLNLIYKSELLSAPAVVRKLKEIHHEYDFIYALDFPVQFNDNFQNWRKTVSTPILCPTRECCFLEFSKLHLKKILIEIGIPTAPYEVIREDEWGRIPDLKSPRFINSEKFVLKVDKCLSFAGFQTRILTPENYKESVYTYRILGETHFVEEYISGTEISAHFLCNGTEWTYLGAARDYKKLFDNDQGPNTSSTGCYSPVDYVTDKIESQMFEYVDKLLAYLNNKGIEYKGIMYLGLMIDANGIVNVLELNSRPGNPEFNAIVNTLSEGLLENLYNAALGLPLANIKRNGKFVITANIVNKNYSLENSIPPKKPIIVADDTVSVCYFNHAIHGHNIFANVLCVGDDLVNTRRKLYDFLSKQEFNDYRTRQDLGELT